LFVSKASCEWGQPGGTVVANTDIAYCVHKPEKQRKRKKKKNKRDDAASGKAQSNKYLDKYAGIPSNPGRLLSRCTSVAAIFTQVKWVGDALKQNAG
jgi:hypothetical protein